LGLVDDLEQAKSRYIKLRADYVKQIRHSKIVAWKEFVTEKGNEDPWDIVYKILRNKTRNDFNSFHAITEGNDSTLTWKETATRLNKMVPDNEDINDRDKKKMEEVESYSNANLKPLISMEEVETALKRAKDKKAPGLDGINPEIVKRLWHVDREVIPCL